MKTLLTLASLFVLPVAIACAADEPAAKPKRDPGAIYKRLDTDGDGTLSYKEWSTGIGGIDPARKPDVFKKKDSDGDGKLTLSEFMFIPPREPAKPAKPAAPGDASKEKKE